MSSFLVDDARRYGLRGWPVLPLSPGGKLPVIASAHRPGEPLCRGECGRDGHGLHDATTDPERIAGWWDRWPTANIGLRTGVSFDVVDIDGPEGLAALNAYRAERPVTWGPEARTGGGGWHLYHLPTGAGNRAGLLPHVDYRGVGGYVVAPPSIHPNGRPYEWQPGAGPDEPLEPLAPWLLELVLPPKSPAPSTTSLDTAAGRVSAYGRRALDVELGRVALAVVGRRNDQLNASAFALGQLVAGGVLPTEVVAAQLMEAARRAGLGDVEAERSIVSGLRAGALSPRGVPA